MVTYPAPVGSKINLMLATISTIGGLVGLAISVALLALQTRAVAKQTQISNIIAGTNAIRDSLADLREINTIFVERPALRSYFYDSKPCPTRGRQCARALAVCEMFADALEVGLQSTASVPSSDSYDDWVSYSKYLLRHSPVLAQQVIEHPDWWPRTHKLL